MSAASNWTIAKDSLSFFGGLLVTVPWLFDFAGRLDLGRFKRISTTMRAHAKIVQEQEAWLAAPKPRDLLLTMIGLFAICLSFGIALAQSLGWIAA